MKIPKYLERALNSAVGLKKIKSWENFTGCIEIQYLDGCRENCRSKADVETALAQLFAVIE